MGARVECTRMEAKGRRNRESRAVAGGSVQRRGTCGRVAVGAWPSRPSAERVRELSRHAGRARANHLEGRGRVGVRRVAGGGTSEGKDVGGAGSVPAAAPVSTGPRLASRDQSFTHVVIRGNASERRYEAPYCRFAAWPGRRILAGIRRRKDGQR